MPAHKKTYQPYEKAITRLVWWEILVNNFMGGIAWALGATVGLAMFFAILTLISKNINFVPVVGSFVSDIINFILATNPNVGK